ncbi:MAG TPA: prepilin-type N-terminal cleavage/methylation domain-containing protein [Abditibacteriaceae bacterium]|jgi:prepilin-type N-terminal cleavage/methylation domain-containing protein
MKREQKAGFTLTEILVTLAVLAVLAAVLFPTFGRVRESGYQTTCMTNLKQIGVATQQYYRDQQRHPASLALLLPPASQIVVATGPRLDTFKHGGSGSDTSRKPVNINEPETVAGTTGYIRDIEVIKCPDDDIEWNLPTSSYETTLVPVWNYLGYLPQGDSHSLDTAQNDPAELMVKPGVKYDALTNPLRMSLSNRFAPPKTVITHCMFHRMTTSDVDNPTLIYQNPQNGAGAKDVILRLDGSAKVVDVSSFAVPKAAGIGTDSDSSGSSKPPGSKPPSSETPGPTTWQTQDF